ncbi:LysE family translocator [Spiribacter vilamensis]|uniref:Threonine/homoserine/homoserine lactone efflux protein n=2 Tax=Spiribacter vilamensis TaxID=531306 RepID=A0A4Q8D1Y3_9GAMM|nr:threonine/homoserine/homoserine lactone efflux protein [Spiribacter vilamensis]TVO62398.1 LysE family translocator [Spiribacter vilamensis]
MQSLFPILGVFAVFSPALMLPGPDFVAVVRNTIGRGTRAGVLTALGVSIGITFYAALSAIGLSTLTSRFDWFEVVIRTGGALFLGYLGLRLLLTRSPVRHIEAEPVNAPGGPRNPLLLGLLVNLTNPKAIVFFASIFGSAFKPETPPIIIAAVIAIVGTCAMAWFSTISLVTASTGLLVRLEDHQHWIERLAGMAFLGFALKIAYDLLLA